MRGGLFKQQQGIISRLKSPVIFYDSFTDTNGVLLPVHIPDQPTLSNWVMQEGSMDILSNEARNLVTSTMAVVNTGISDVYIELEQAGDSNIGISFRFLDNNNYWNFWAGDGGLYEIVGGVQTKRGTVTGVCAVGDVMKLAAIGDEIMYQRNDDTPHTWTSNINKTNVKHGMRGYSIAVRVNSYTIETRV